MEQITATGIARGVVAKKAALLLALVMTILLSAAAQAFAQEQEPVTATGVLGEPITQGEDPEPFYPLTDEETGSTFELTSGSADLAPFVGERVTVQGVPVPGTNPQALDVTQIDPADADAPSDPADGETPSDPADGETPSDPTDGDAPAPDDKATLSFELTVKGEPPDGTTLLGFIPAEGGIRVPLSDADGDGVFTGSTTLDRFGPGPRPVPPGTQPVSLPVQIAQEDSGGNIEVIRDFGEVALTGDRTFKARVNFKNDDRGDSTTPEDDPADNGGSGDDSSSDNSGGDGSADSGSSGSDSKSGGGSSGGSLKVLPNTGGATVPMVGVVGALLVGSGLLVRRIIR